jgi:tetratricopeptide (TPR) repeat protein
VTVGQSWRRRAARSALVCATALLMLASWRLSAAEPASPAARAEELARHRNVGKALYENPTTQYQAVEELHKAVALAPGSAADRLNYGLALLRAGKEAEGIAELVAVQKQAPALPHTWWNLGIAYQRASRSDEARAQLEGMAARVPNDAATHYNLGVLYKIAGQNERALHELEEAARLDPDMAAPRYQLHALYRQAGRADDAAKALAAFRELKAAQAGAAVPEDPQWNRYSELLDPVEPRGVGAAAALPPPKPPSFAARPPVALAGGKGGAPEAAGLALIDADGDEKPDLLAWSGGRLQLLASGARLVAGAGLDALADVVAAVPGDFDNDGRADLAVLTGKGVHLLANRGGRFAEVAAPLPGKAFRAAAWVDEDHDYDVDLVLLGDSAALLRNNGDGTWTDNTARFPFVAGHALSVAVLDVVANDQDEDLAVSYADHPGVLYRDRLGGRYTSEPLPALPAGAHALAAFDADGDGWTDVTATVAGRPLRLVNQREEGKLEAGWRPVAPPAAARVPFTFADLQSRGAADLVVAGAVFFARGAGAFGAATPLPGSGGAIDDLVAADFDADGRTDLALLAGGPGGHSVRLLVNQTPGTGRWLRIGLRGVKNLQLAPGSEVEVKAGGSYQKRRYAGVPLLFGLGRRDAADTVRITWGNGLIQNETGMHAGEGRTIKEAPRLSGSCPMIFTWDGARYRFITDVLGVAPLGASAGDGEYFPVDHDEYVQVPGEALVPVDGRLSVHVTEELREVSYLDQIQLVAVDHPAKVEVFTNEKFVGPPFPEFRLFGVERRIHPVRATGNGGRDVRAELQARDGRYPTDFPHDFAGVASAHHLDLDFGTAASASNAGPGKRTVLVLSGWVDWADGSTFLGTAQRQGGGLLMPQLQVKDERGEWQTVVADMGIPAGKPKTIVVDLTGKWLTASREVRIVTNLCVYWDEIFLAEADEPAPVRLTRVEPASADLHFRGFSVPTIDPRRQQPEKFDYHRLLAQPPWNPTPGLYTRFGDVRELLAAADDFLVVMGSGDEVALDFDAAALPPLDAGWRRDYLLLVDGWAKDGDANTAFSQSVEPLPFHAMSQYPYPETERFPDDARHRQWRAETLIRPALRLLPPLERVRRTAAAPPPRPPESDTP